VDSNGGLLFSQTSVCLFFAVFGGMVWCGNGRFMIAFSLEMYDLQMMSNEAAWYK
jgi:hypothetical protein